MLKELENVNSDLDDLATIYTKTVEGNVVEEQLYIRECEDIFDQVCDYAGGGGDGYMTMMMGVVVMGT